MSRAPKYDFILVRSHIINGEERDSAPSVAKGKDWTELTRAQAYTLNGYELTEQRTFSHGKKGEYSARVVITRYANPQRTGAPDMRVSWDAYRVPQSAKGWRESYILDNWERAKVEDSTKGLLVTFYATAPDGTDEQSATYCPSLGQFIN